MTTQTRLFASEYPKRPSRHDDAVIKKTAEAMSKDVATWADDDADEDEVTQHLIKALDLNFDDNGTAWAGQFVGAGNDRQSLGRSRVGGPATRNIVRR